MRIAVVAGPDPGHVFPAVALATRLRDRAHDVLVVTGERWREALDRERVEFLPLPLLAADPRDSDFGFVLWGRGQAMAPPLARMLRDWAPDAVVADTITVPGWFAADLLGVPRVELVPHTLQLPSRALPPPGSGLEPGRGPLGWWRDTTLRWFAARSNRAAAAERDAARAAIGLPPGGAPAARLVATIPALEPDRPDWPPDTYVVGPLEWDPATAELQPSPGDAPLVFLADSSAAGRPQALLELAITGLTGAGVRLVATRFERWNGGSDWVAAGPGRQAPLLDAASAVVCAGGHGMVCKALARGLPLVVVPGPGDQRANAVRVATLGAGVHLPPDRATPERLAAAVREVTGDPAYAEAARRVRASLDAVTTDAVTVVERVARPA